MNRTVDRAVRAGLAAAAFALGATAAGAEEAAPQQVFHESFNPAGLTNVAGIVSQMSLTEVSQLMAEIGGTPTITADGDRPMVVTQFANGLVLLAIPLGCGTDDASPTATTPCRRVDIATIFDQSVFGAVPSDRLNDWNSYATPATAARLLDGSLLLRRYVVLDGGITRGNLAASIITFADAGGEFLGSLGGATTASATPDAARAVPAALTDGFDFGTLMGSPFAVRHMR
ncbi:MAG: YbjN domain-containing protein [Alphaproteobacteria bacterium]|nr:YbjN domain-containing protein [Alphaproteobacteria bacterium]